MSMSDIEIPLFPLDVVLFPGTALPLHIFEARYRSLITDCQRDHMPFGVVLAKPESVYLEEEPFSVGTMAVIHNLERLPDDRYTLMAVGTQRFRIVELHRTTPYLSGVVELLYDDAEPDEMLYPPMTQANSLFLRYLNMVLECMNEEGNTVALPELPEDLSYFIAYFLEIQNEVKQHLLELTSTRQRLQEEIEILRREVPFMRQILSKEISEERCMLN